MLNKQLGLKFLLGAIFLQTISISATDYTQLIGDLAKGAVNETYQAGKIVTGSIAAAVTYGIANDMITARVCPEYFTEGFHREALRWMDLSIETRQSLLNTANVNQIALWWGVRATWWFGRDLAIPVICAARIGSWPQLGMEDIIKPLAIGLGSLWTAGMVAGGIGYSIAKNNPEFRDEIIRLSGASSIIDNETKCRYVADTFTHQIGYAGGAAVGAGIVGYTLWQRYKKSKAIL